ncbi:thermonuclease family protein [Candidatus Shapirobacteria bacterium]|nr:thermonuclease family protein [Candidatus Shapirobacteria bacterium]
MKWWVVGIIIVTIIGIIIFRPDTTDDTDKTYTVKRVIDGDTLVIDNNQLVRLANIDAPEKGLCGFDEAKNELEKMVLNKKITIEGDTNDKWGRLLVTVWVNKEMINEKIVKSGWVRYDSQGKNKYLQDVDNAVEKEKKGIYGKCVEETNNVKPNCLIKGNNRNGNKIFVKPGCKNYSITDIATDQGDQWFCSEAEAVEAGYKKALNCML